MKAKAFFSTRFRMAAIVLSGLLLLALYLGGLSAQARPDLEPAVEVESAAPQMAAIPVVTLTVPSEVLIGEQFTFQVTFQNTGTLSSAGYAPFIDLVLDAGGADFNASVLPCDGITFVPQAQMVVSSGSLDLTTYPSFATPAPCPSPLPPTATISHQYAPNGVSPSGVIVPAGAQLVTIELPFGSYQPTQPPIVVDVTAKVHEYADVGHPLKIYARGGFRYGKSPLPGTPILSHLSDDSTTWLSDVTTPTLFTLKKQYLGPENENATGPNFVGYYPLQYQITLDIAAGQTITDVVVTDTLPNNMVFQSVVSTSPTGVITPPGPTPGNGETLVVEFGTITGTNASADASILFELHIPKEDADGNPILDPNTCYPPVESINDVKATGLWDPLDPRDVGPVPVVSDITNQDHILLNKCLAIQKSVTIADDTGASGATPGDILEYRLKFQVSDFFTIGNLVIDDFLSDGQLLITSTLPTLTVSDQFGTVSDTFTIGNDFIKTADPDIECGIVQGGTHLEFLVSQAMQNLTSIPPLNAGILTGGHATTPTSTTPATGEIVFFVEIQDEFDFPHPGDEFVDKHDPMNNCVTIKGEVFTNVSNPQPTGVIAEDHSQTSISIVHGILSKEVYAVNGNTSLSPPIQVAAGDDITFRITYDAIPSGDAEYLSFEDFFPLPVLNIGSWINFLYSPNGIPLPNNGNLLWTDTCHLLSTLPAPAVTPNTGSNSLLFDYGSFNDPTNTPCVIDFLITLTVTSDPYADGLLMTNEVVECEENSFAETFCQVALAQFEVTQPVLKISKGVVATDNPKAEFMPSTVGPVSFTSPPPDSTCPRFSSPQIIHSTNLVGAPINSNVKYVDAGDWVTFAVVVENTGSGLNGAFDVQIKDILPPEFINAQNLCVRDGAGDTMPFTGTLVDFFGPGIKLTDPGPTIAPAGALDPDNATNTSGRNIAVITFDAQLRPADELQKGQCIQNEAELLQYAGIEGGPDHVQAGFGGPYVDTAEVCILPLAEKSIVSTSEAHTTPNDSASGTPQLTIGEIVRYRLWVRLPEGSSPAFKLIDTLPAGLSLIDPNKVMISFTADNPMTLPTDLVAAQNNADPPTFVLPSGRISTAGQTTTFDLGNLVNNDNDDDWELLLIEFNALVENSSANNNGNSKSNQFSVEVNGQSVATSNSVSAQIVEPSLTVSKDVVNAVANATVLVGSSVVYQITVQNTGPATAFDVQIDDPLPGCLVNLQVVNINPTGGVVGIVDSSTSSKLDVSIAELPVGDQVVIEIAVQVDCLQCNELENTVKVSYTSLLGVNGTVPNPTGSVTPGASGDPDGERNGSSGVNDYITEASAPLCGEICGVKFHDQNRNGVQEPGEATLAGWLIEIQNAASTIVGTATTNANGEYCAEVPFGSVNVSEIQQHYWTQIFPAAPGTHTVTLDPANSLVQQIDFGNATCAAPPADMVAWWSLDEPTGSTAADFAMFKNQGTHVSNPFPVAGMVDGALSFNGINQYVRVPDHSEINFGTGDLSIDAWIKTSSTNDYQVIVDKRGDTPIGPVGYTFLLYRGQLMFQLAADNGWSSYYNSSSSDLRDGAWHFVAVTVDRDDMAGGKLYVDGTLIHTFNPVKRSGSITNAADLWIGKHHPAGDYPHDRWFKGRIDEVEMFNRALTATTIWDIWLANSDGKCKYPDLEIEKRHVGHFEKAGVGTYVIEVTNVGNGESYGPITVSDTIPAGATYLSGGGGGWTCPLGPMTGPATITCSYIGPPSLPLARGQTLPPLVINVQLSNLPELKNCAQVEGYGDHNPANDESCDVVELMQPINAPDLGDAPDSINQSGNRMTAYNPMPSPANFPTTSIYGSSRAYPGPEHTQPEDDALLGLAVSQEVDADQTPDQDSNITNIDPPNNQANRDEYDDGVRLNTVNLPNCGQTRFQYDVNVINKAGGISPQTRRLNVWFDYNQDGDWNDWVLCRIRVWPRRTIRVPEWSVRNAPVTLTDGYHTNLNTPYFWATGPTTVWPSRVKGMWMRTTLTSRNDLMPGFGFPATNGSGPKSGYDYGETEDYHLPFRWWWLVATPSVGVSTTFTQINGFVDELTIPAQAVTEPMTVTIAPVSSEGVAGGLLIHRRFDMDAYSEDGELVENFTFEQPVNLTLHYTDEERAALRRPGGSALQLLRNDPDNGWVEAGCGDVIDDPDTNSLSVPVCQTGEFALASGTPTGISISAPVRTDEEAGSEVSLPITIAPYADDVEIEAYDFTLHYDPSVISITGVSQAGTLSEEWSVTSDTSMPGQLVITANGETSLADGALINLTANLTTTTGVTTTLTFGEVTVNDGDLSVIPQPGILAIQPPPTTGRILYLPLIAKR